MGKASMRIAYADPPYIGQARRLYGEEEVDHAALIGTLRSYDGWALSCSSPTLVDVLTLCEALLPVQPRVAAWVKPFAVFKPNVNPAYAWDPVLFVPARKRGRDQATVRDWISCNITLKKGLVGAKPEAFCMWLFDLLQMDRTDTLDDLFPGTGAVGAAFAKWSTQPTEVEPSLSAQP